MDVEVNNFPAYRVAAVRHIGAYNRISEAFSTLGDIAGAAGLFGPDTMMLALYHDDPETTAESELRSDAGVTVAQGVSLPPGLTEQRIPAGRYARARYIGPYEGLGDAWSRFMSEWLPSTDERTSDGVSYEVYLNDPSDTAPEDLITDMYIPLA